MYIDNLWLYVLASLLLLLGHVIRAARWALLFPTHQINGRFVLLLGLALAYAINAVVPWRLGEIVRIWFVARRESVRFSSVATTVVAERLSDLVVVSTLATFMLLAHDSNAWPFPLLPIVMSGLLIGTSVLIQKSQKARRIIWQGTSIFNDRIRFSFLDFFWSLSEVIRGGSLLKRRFLAATAAMWAIYVLSYVTFSSAAGQSSSDMFFAMLGSPLRAASEQMMVGNRSAAFTLLGYTCLPVLGILVYGGVKQFPAIIRVLNARRRYGWYASRSTQISVRNRFKAEGEYEFFLVSLFSGDDKVATKFGLEAIDDGTVNKLFAGGSDAITALVEVGQNLIIRKFAVGAAAYKLKAQHDWLIQYQSNDFPLVDIIRCREKSECYYYDMPLVVPANDFYDFIHTNPVERSIKIIEEVTSHINAFHNQNSGSAADDAIVFKYLNEKGSVNAKLILDFARTIFSGNEYTINGTKFYLRDWDYLLNHEWLSNQIRHRTMTVVHGDLTIENIIVTPKQSPNWYVIDPNPDNVFNTCLIDWAKLMQSVNLGYEGLNRNFGCIISNDEIQLAFTKSKAYTDLHSQIEKLILRQFGKDGLREVYFHELINYLRLTPYKIRHDARKGICFLACTSILLSRYLERAL